MKKVYFYVNLGLNRITPYALLAKARNTVELMTGNPAYAGASATLTATTAAADAMEKAINAFLLNPGPRERSERFLAFEALKGLMVDLGAIVQTESNGDRKTIEAAGLTVRKDATPMGELPTPTGISARENRIPGRIDVRWPGIRGRLFYRLFMCAGDPKDEKSWELVVQTSKNRHTLTGLTSDQVYFFRVQAQGVAGLTAMSESVDAKAA